MRVICHNQHISGQFQVSPGNHYSSQQSICGKKRNMSTGSLSPFFRWSRQERPLTLDPVFFFFYGFAEYKHSHKKLLTTKFMDTSVTQLWHRATLHSKHCSQSCYYYSCPREVFLSIPHPVHHLYAEAQGGSLLTQK